MLFAQSAMHRGVPVLSLFLRSTFVFLGGDRLHSVTSSFTNLSEMHTHTHTQREHKGHGSENLHTFLRPR